MRPVYGPPIWPAAISPWQTSLSRSVNTRQTRIQSPWQLRTLILCTGAGWNSLGHPGLGSTFQLRDFSGKEIASVFKENELPEGNREVVCLFKKKAIWYGTPVKPKFILLLDRPKTRTIFAIFNVANCLIVRPPNTKGANKKYSGRTNRRPNFGRFVQKGPNRRRTS